MEKLNVQSLDLNLFGLHISKKVKISSTYTQCTGLQNN